MELIKVGMEMLNCCILGGSGGIWGFTHCESLQSHVGNFVVHPLHDGFKAILGSAKESKCRRNGSARYFSAQKLFHSLLLAHSLLQIYASSWNMNKLGVEKKKKKEKIRISSQEFQNQLCGFGSWSILRCVFCAFFFFPAMLRPSLPIGSASNFVTNIHDKAPVLTGVVFICSFFWGKK